LAGASGATRTAGRTSFRSWSSCPIIIRSAPHFFIGGGPIYSTTLLSEQGNFDEPRRTIIGLQATLGGYFRGMEPSQR
jgi:hypothetical protein